MPNRLIVIPARLNSTRLPKKMLLQETGKTMLQHTYDAAKDSRLAQEVVVATDSPEIVEVVNGFGGRAIMTDENHQSGTDRVAEVAMKMPEFDIVVNLQGDEPEILGSSIDMAIKTLEMDPDLSISTVAAPLDEATRLHDPSCVKVVFDANNRAMYFSRSPIPHPRENEAQWLSAKPPIFFQHIGLYVYRREFLQNLSKLQPSTIEQVEKLEQLRFLNAGFSIGVGIIEHATKGIDTAEDYEAFVKRLANC
jgi:3-deoxy-manno-octulosonate cytidylyltransferase (CMP-KDO synthetase)